MISIRPQRKGSVTLRTAEFVCFLAVCTEFQTRSQDPLKGHFVIIAPWFWPTYERRVTRSWSVCTIASTKAKVKDVEKLNKVMDHYESRGFGITVDEEGNLEVVKSRDGYDYPEALKKAQLLRKKLYASQDDWFFALSDLFDQKGDAGFLSWLEEIATCLETPLMILTLVRSNTDSDCQVWRVAPGEKEVETLSTSIG